MKERLTPAQVTIESQAEENSGDSQAGRESEPYSYEAHIRLETKKIRHWNPDNEITDKCDIHNRLDILYAPEGICETKLQAVAQLI